MQIDMQAENGDCHSTDFIIHWMQNRKRKSQQQQKLYDQLKIVEISSMYGFNASSETNNWWKISSRTGRCLQKWNNKNVLMIDDGNCWHSNECNLNGEHCKLKTIFLRSAMHSDREKEIIIHLLGAAIDWPTQNEKNI